jgi:uncharacterized protein (DUF1778 family)
MTTQKKASKAETSTAMRRKRQVKGKRHDHRVDVYFSKEEKSVVEQAASQAGISASQYCARLALQTAKKELEGKK